MKFSKQLPVGTIALGVILGAVNVVSMMMSDKYFPKLVVFACILLLFGIATLIFPGGDPGPEVPSNKKLAYSFSKASMVGKIMWILFAIAGLVLGFWIDITFLGGL